jgi:hypothetical protein
LGGYKIHTTRVTFDNFCAGKQKCFWTFVPRSAAVLRYIEDLLAYPLVEIPTKHCSDQSGTRYRDEIPLAWAGATREGDHIDICIASTIQFLVRPYLTQKLFLACPTSRTEPYRPKPTFILDKARCQQQILVPHSRWADSSTQVPQYVWKDSFKTRPDCL